MAIGRIPEPGTGIPESIIAAKGDLLTGTANDTPAVLTVGANGTTLVADSSEATGLKWQAAASASPASASATVATSQTTSSTSYTDLTTTGPAVTITTGTKALVITSTSFQNASGGNFIYASFAVSGATTIAATDSYALGMQQQATNRPIFASRATRLSSLTAGSNTFTMKYRGSGDTCTFENREIIVIDLGS